MRLALTRWSARLVHGRNFFLPESKGKKDGYHFEGGKCSDIKPLFDRCITLPIQGFELNILSEGEIMGLLSNRIGKESLKPGDHIYSWRTAYIYAHHGIYVGDDKVIHFTRGRGQEVGTGTVLDVFLSSSGPKRSSIPCQACTSQSSESRGVMSSCLNCFLAGGVLYRFEYGVSRALFLAKARGGTCTLAVSDPDEMVVHRAKYLLSNGFRCYSLFKSNCEDFAIYCKTGLLGVVGQSGQAVSVISGPLAAALSTPLRLITTNVYGMAVTAVGVYCASRYIADIGNRNDVVRISVEELTAGLASGRVQVVEGTHLTLASQ